MKKILILLLIATLISCNHSIDNQSLQSDSKTKYHKILDTFDFDKSKYCLLIAHSTQEADYVHDTGHYFINNTKILKQLQKKWVLEPETNHVFRLDPDYQLYIMKNDSLIADIGIDKEKNILILDSINYKFPFDKFLAKYLCKQNKSYVHKYEFSSTSEWYDFKNKINMNNILINDIYLYGHYRSSSIVFKYSHFFRIKYEIPFKDGRKYQATSCFHVQRPILSEKILKKYNTSNFYLISIYGKYNAKQKEIYDYVDIFCNEDLYKKFDLYKRVNNFKELPLKLTFFSKDSLIFKEN